MRFNRGNLPVATARLLQDVRACKLCEPHLPLGARPVLQVHPEARILVVGQAPGTKVHSSGVPFDDASGERLREWLETLKTRSRLVLPVLFGPLDRTA